MALTATIFKAELNISDMDRHYYGSHVLTIAQHPSETDARMMVRILAFALNASEQLSFTKGLCVDDEPELWEKSLSDEVERWIELGQPDEKRIKKACGRAKEVFLYCYSGNSADIWWKNNQTNLARYNNLRVINVAKEQVDALANVVERNMLLQCTIQDKEIWISSDQGDVHVTPEEWKGD